jgi:hypothetical protein
VPETTVNVIEDSSFYIEVLRQPARIADMTVNHGENVEKSAGDRSYIKVFDRLILA